MEDKNEVTRIWRLRAKLTDDLRETRLSPEEYVELERRSGLDAGKVSLRSKRGAAK